MKQKNEILGLLRDLQVKFPRLYTRMLTRVDLTLPQYALLSQLTSERPIPMTEISEKLLISKPAVTSLVDRLEKKKYLRRTLHLTDRRIYLIQLLPKGEKLIQEIRSHVLGLFLKTLGRFTKKEREIVGHFYAGLSETMEKALSAVGKQSKGRP